MQKLLVLDGTPSLRYGMSLLANISDRSRHGFQTQQLPIDALVRDRPRVKRQALACIRVFNEERISMELTRSAKIAISDLLT